MTDGRRGGLLVHDVGSPLMTGDDGAHHVRGVDDGLRLDRRLLLELLYLLDLASLVGDGEWHAHACAWAVVVLGLNSKTHV